jgi:hypothetical protein
MTRSHRIERLVKTGDRMGAYVSQLWMWDNALGEVGSG